MSGYRSTVPTHQLPHRCPGFLTDLILRCAAGDELALGSLFDHAYPLVRSLAVDHSGFHSGNDLVVTVFRRLWEQASTHDPKTSEAVEWVTSQTRAVLEENAQLLSAVSRAREAPVIVSPR